MYAPLITQVRVHHIFHLLATDISKFREHELDKQWPTSKCMLLLNRVAPSFNIARGLSLSPHCYIGPAPPMQKARLHRGSPECQWRPKIRTSELTVWWTDTPIGFSIPAAHMSSPAQPSPAGRCRPSSLHSRHCLCEFTTLLFWPESTHAWWVLLLLFTVACCGTSSASPWV